MNDLQIRPGNLPANIDDLAKFALIGREKLVAVRAEIRAIEKVGLAREVREQKLREAQEISEAVLDAEVRIGELMAKVPKATKGSGGNRYQRAPVRENDSDADFSKPKADVIRDAGFKPWQVQRFQTLAANLELVAEAKAEARENDDIVSRSQVLDKVQAKRREEERRERAKADERIEASLKSTKAYLDTVKRQHGVEDDNTVDLTMYQAAKREADYDRKIADSRQYKLLDDLFKTANKLPKDTALYEAMWRGSYDTGADVEQIKKLIDQLNAIMALFIQKGRRDILDEFDD